MRAPCGFPRQNPGLNFPALPASDHTPLVPPGELARQASLGAEPALSPLISRSVSRWIYHWVIKAINKSLIVGWARPGTHAPCIVLSSKRAHTAPETMPYFLPGSCRPKPASWARPRALAKPLSWSPMDLAIPMTRVVASSLQSKRTGVKWPWPGQRAVTPRGCYCQISRLLSGQEFEALGNVGFMSQPLPGIWMQSRI